MKRAYILLASGYEEVEALMPADVMRRAGYEVYLVSATGEPIVKGVHNIEVKTDAFLNDVSVENGDLIMLPGGIPGATNLLANEKVKTLFQGFMKIVGGLQRFVLLQWFWVK